VTFQSFLGGRPFEVEGAAFPAARGGARWTYVTAIEPNFFTVHGRPVQAGRAFEAGDLTAAGPRLAIVNEAFVRRQLPAGRPIGRRIRPVDPRSGLPSGESVEIVGVVGDVLNLEISQRGPGWVAYPTVYVPLTATTASQIRMMVRAQDPARLVGGLRTVAAEMDPTMVLHRPRPLEEVDRIALSFVHLYGFAVGFLVFAVLVLSTAGIYSMMSFTVAQRTREIGIRTALGANPTRVVREIFSRAMAQLGAGTLLGLGIGFVAAAGPFALSDGPFSEGPGLVLGIATLILGMGLIGCGRPIRRALRIQPAEALRDDG
jgi:hypothetical protein